ncbi:MAG: DUF1073 domain-containing protein [bacterium]|nr:DUF1073 domain-containing protein [bacterium]
MYQEQTIDVIKKRSSKLDGIQNIITGLNRKTKDKRINVVAIPDLLTKQGAEDLYAADRTARKIIEKVPKEGVKKWIELINADPAIKLSFKHEFRKLKVVKQFKKAWQWARLYGGAGIFLNIDDGEYPSFPINFTKAKSIKTIIALHRYELFAETQTVEKNIDNPNFGLPNYYRIQKQNNGATSLIHHDRILRFEGAELPQTLFMRNGYWHDSVLSSLKNPIINYSQSHDMLASIIQDFRQKVMKIDQFAQMIAADEDDLLIKRMEIQDLIRSNFKTEMIDKEDELDIVQTSFSGINDALKMVNNRLVEASDFPHTVLLGESPKGGISDKGESQNRDWYDYVAEEQRDVLEEPINTLLEYLMKVKEGPTKGKFLDSLSFEFLPLWQMSEEKQSEIQLNTAKRDEIYIQNQVVTPEEVAISRWGSGKFNMETTLESTNRNPLHNVDSEDTKTK